MLFSITIILASIVFAAFLISAELGILFAFLTKPVIDTSWPYFIGDINLLRIVGVVVPLLVLARSFSSDKRFNTLPLFRIWMIYIIYNMLTFSFSVFEHGVVKYLDLVFRILNAFVGYYMVQTYFSNKDAFKKLLVVLLLAGAFPIIMGLYQAATGIVWQERVSVGLTRYVGLYHNAQNMRWYAFQTLTAVILYWSYFLPKRGAVTKKILLLSYTAACAIVLFNIHSKAAYVIAAAWIIIWMVTRRQFLPMVLMLSILTTLSIVYKDTIWRDTQQVFWKETVVIKGDTSERAIKRTLAGRWYGWEYLLTDYWEKPFLSKIFGTGDPKAPHNDFLRSLLSGGMIGLLIYITLLMAIGIRIFMNYRQDPSPLNVMALMIFVMWMIDTIGTHPGLSPSYQWYVWGIIGLSFTDIHLEEMRRNAYRYRDSIEIGKL